MELKQALYTELLKQFTVHTIIFQNLNKYEPHFLNITPDCFEWI
jgi:hypothetical protein